jgi:hypothetical protein
VEPYLAKLPASVDKLFWVMARRFLAWGSRKSLIIVPPEIVVRWHRAGFRAHPSTGESRKELCQSNTIAFQHGVEELQRICTDAGGKGEEFRLRT